MVKTLRKRRVLEFRREKVTVEVTSVFHEVQKIDTKQNGKKKIIEYLFEKYINLVTNCLVFVLICIPMYFVLC